MLLVPSSVCLIPCSGYSHLQTIHLLQVRRIVVETLPRVCTQGDPLVLEAISSLTADPVNKVKITAMDALSNLCTRGDPLVVTNLCDMLEDPDTAVRH